MEKLILAFFALFNCFVCPSTNKGMINRELPAPAAEQYDGPYVQYKNENIFVHYIMADGGKKISKTDSFNIREKNTLSLHVMTDVPGKFLQVGLKKELKNEKSEFSDVKNLVVLSDIEGNFTAFRKLLQANKVIDQNFKWIFNKGHLVLVGDFFDRGQQVTETLWFIYYLEEQAKANGGYVHFILGNHEIMNLTGDLRYIDKKYLDNAAVLERNYVTLYNENFELGKWLRTKNIVEKIGDMVFVHGGISGNINSMNISVPDINKLARPYYADTSFNYKDSRSDVIMGDLGPFWYRGYYTKNNTGIQSQIDSTLSLFGVDRIITGHSIVADTISVWYQGKLLNTDVHHAGGKSEALCIEKGKYYRVNADGTRVLLLEKK